MGRQIGEALQKEIRGFTEIALECVNKTIAVSRDTAMSVSPKRRADALLSRLLPR